MPDLDLVPLSSKIRAHLRKAGYTTTHEALCTPPSALQKRTGLQPDEAETAIRAIADFCLPPCISVAEALKTSPPRYLSVGAGKAFDDLFGNGIRAGSLTEIVGESATGKSNLCMQLALQAQLPVELGGLCASALYLTSETSQSAFPSNRLLELARALESKHGDGLHIPSEADLLGNVHLGNATTLETLDLIISHHAPHLAGELRSKNCPRLGLIIVDSLAAPSRADFATNTVSGLSDRAKALAVLGDKLKAIAYELNLAIVVINQVSDVFQGPVSLPSTPGESSINGHASTMFAEEVDDELDLSYDSQARFFSGQAPGLAKQAALGLVWANAIDTRVMLSHTRRTRRRDGAKPSMEQVKLSIRKATLVFSAFAQPASLDYVITEAGLEAISELGHVGERWFTAACSTDDDNLLSLSEDQWDDQLLSDDLRLVVP